MADDSDSKADLLSDTDFTQPDEEEEESISCQLFVGGIQPEATESDIESYFSAFGAVREIKMIRDKITSKIRGHFLTI